MRFLTRAAVSAAAVAVAAAMAPVVPAHAADGGWEYVSYPSIMVSEEFWMHKHIDGHLGNWHQIALYIQQDDDGVVGGVRDMRCPRGVKPDTQGFPQCTTLANAEFDQHQGLTVTWEPRLRKIHVYGPIRLDYYYPSENTSVMTTMDLRLLADGKFTRTVTYGAPTSTDPMEYKTVDIFRGGKITARGYVDYLKSTKPQYKRTEPLHVYWIKARIPPV